MHRHVKIVLSVTCAVAFCCIYMQVHADTKLETVTDDVRQGLTGKSSADISYDKDVKPIIDSRCVACHACYDAPCQLKTTAAEALARGGSKAEIYHTSRIVPADPSRMFFDTQTTGGWRSRGFFDVLGEQSDDRIESGLIKRFLQLKQQQPVEPPGSVLPDEYTVSFERDNTCPTNDEFAAYAKHHPEGGMPYALPALSTTEHDTIVAWLDAGAAYTSRVDPAPEFQASIEKWEAFFNRSEIKGRLVARYLYEHLYIGHLYFPEISDNTFFRLVRSATAPGKPIQMISTRRPFDDPGVERVYYRLLQERETIVAKTHNPYALNAQRMSRFEELFFQNNYQVTQLPGYTAKSNANPFITFSAIPLKSRYKYLLDESRFTIANYIRGTVCRGQIAVSVIRDRFWVVFLNPDSSLSHAMASFLPAVSSELALGNTRDSGTGITPLMRWHHYEKLQRKYQQTREQALAGWFSKHDISLDLVWDGDNGTNSNAALTVLRHGDNAAVELGLLGASPPDTAWVIDYPLLERIHYLLVADYDVYGSFGHQLTSRFHMDFLRMQGEKNFLGYLPSDTRAQVTEQWYRDAPDKALEYMATPTLDSATIQGIDYQTEDPLQELYGMLADRLEKIQPDIPELGAELMALENFQGDKTVLLPQVSLLRINGDTTRYASIIRNDAHLNMSSVFKEKKQRIPSENTITVLPGIRGYYPNALLQVSDTEVGAFVDAVLALDDEHDYAQLMDKYAIRRTDPDFWMYSDQLHTQWRKKDPTGFGYLDYSRLENR